MDHFAGRAASCDDALLKPFDANGREYMEYLRAQGIFFDVPAEFLMTTTARCYPALGPAGLGDIESDIADHFLKFHKRHRPI
ncbi:hypothetical protein [Candidatus Nitrotoga sp. M5]|uniref:hypothetical protein n=1 Tax=Candidatus Nitrotoga sp. M5 TaxID=2890409 RepID=UPI001EF62933|nr:hypothetical protein [Candidatus Nitrotoga sp. M5]